MHEIEVSAVLPVYNDREALMTAVPQSLEVLEAIAPGSFELIVAEDGSSDGSAEFVGEWEAREPRVRLMHSDERLGRGRALNRAFAGAKGSIVCYYDVDLATDMQHLAELIGAVRDGYDIVTGSRLLPKSDITRSGGREIASRGYNMLVRMVLGSSLHDHQCGFKAFRRDRLLDLLPSVSADHWFWDTEVLVRAQKRGYRVREFPVRWRQGPGTTVRRKDVVEMGSAVIALWWRLHVEKG
ncbi:dolichyl-phosphate beta-glucosyltransferase [Methanoculleus sp. 7T]|uniref:dolichyl-phosphate beta-glucosyltransferase n=1 Tax=Methanoculleus sp. 7T TaxID=2937282 RepID=UPI0020BFDB7D|nr:dolichyl-phosphate beta-glucosyltransferase [Methanoculleus sp. 7T]MCK8517877.1 glycosyltransferase family 2 protein [Methanoculleus sp. 7T]